MMIPLYYLACAACTMAPAQHSDKMVSMMTPGICRLPLTHGHTIHLTTLPQYFQCQEPTRQETVTMKGSSESRNQRQLECALSFKTYLRKWQNPYKSAQRTEIWECTENRTIVNIFTRGSSIET